jgi:hypothetical protein
MPFPPDITNPRNLTERFSQLIGRLQRALFTCYNITLPVQTSVQQLAWHWMARLRRRFASLAERQLAGTLPALRPLPAAPPEAAAHPAAPRPAAPRPPNPLPRKPGWLLREAWEPCHLNAQRSRLQAFLADPELAALAAVAPQVGRLLRPLCRMLNEPVPHAFALPKRPRRPRAQAAPKPRPPKFMDINRMSAVAWGNFVHPDHPGQHHPPSKIGYGGSWWPPKKPR